MNSLNQSSTLLYFLLTCLKMYGTCCSNSSIHPNWPLAELKSMATSSSTGGATLGGSGAPGAPLCGGLPLVFFSSSAWCLAIAASWASWYSRIFGSSSSLRSCFTILISFSFFRLTQNKILYRLATNKHGVCSDFCKSSTQNISFFRSWSLDNLLSPTPSLSKTLQLSTTIHLHLGFL